MNLLTTLNSHPLLNKLSNAFDTCHYLADMDAEFTEIVRATWAIDGKDQRRRVASDILVLLVALVSHDSLDCFVGSSKDEWANLYRSFAEDILKAL